MNVRTKAAFLAMVVLQAAHSVEEIIFKFHEAFPPMQSIYRRAPSLAQPAFVLFNSVLILSALLCFFHWVRPARAGARAVLWVWVGIQLATVAAHVVWLALAGGYHPGLATVPALAAAAAYMTYRLAGASPAAP